MPSAPQATHKDEDIISLGHKPTGTLFPWVTSPSIPPRGYFLKAWELAQRKGAGTGLVAPCTSHARSARKYPACTRAQLLSDISPAHPQICKVFLMCVCLYIADKCLCMQQMKSQLENGKGWSQGQDQGPGQAKERAMLKCAQKEPKGCFAPPCATRPG